MRTLGLAAAVALGSVSGALLGYAALAGGDKVAFPEGFDKGVRYATLDRHDIKQYRELYAAPAAVEAVRKGRPIPSGAVLTLVQYKAQLDSAGNPIRDADGRFRKGDLVAYAVMEKRDGWGGGYSDDLRNGEWEYQVFGPDRQASVTANLTGCFQCHKPHAGQDFVISLASLKGTPESAADQSVPAPRDVSIADFKFGPATVVVNKGQPVTWHNVDTSPHQITITGAKPQRSSIMLKGQTTQLTLADAGIYDYICSLHPAMRGKIEVK
ncbi:cytochrome P460 family protein [Bradyrhizobium sp. LHD-71]|uniref:cytochrome P460 family protein n=1 Tax=Bradyrhizobium sp. LHD-71 TaxID=3072141 RepID=UPI00280FBA12|nr:cytochrome P460 family protein [Bradyrhizobium sp. LHD-71]MDQ8732419.1 cytochrome P460 family protein [Bradyrhizobium sp. LHD-71]